MSAIADTVPVVAWLAPFSGATTSDASIGAAWVSDQRGKPAQPLVRQSDHLSAIAALQAQIAELSAPQPAADERVAEHIRTVAKACAASRSVGIAAAMNRDQLGAAYVEESAALAAVESSARALLAAGREEVAAAPSNPTP